VPASSCAEAAISWAEALVCSVLAETSSLEAEDCSAIEATSPMSWVMALDAWAISAAVSATWPMRSFIDVTRSVMRSNASRAAWTVWAPSAVRVAPLSTTVTVLAVSDWISAMSVEIEAAACWDSSASLRTSSATTAKPRPCSPARAASIAAFKANRLVCSAIVVIVSTIPPICSLLAPRARIASLACWAEPVTSAIISVACATDAAPSVATRPASAASPWASRAACADADADADSCSTLAFVDSTDRTWRSEPAATSETAWAISLTARPVSSEVLAICSDAVLIVDDAPATLEIMSRRPAVICDSALPSTSRSERAWISTVRSPSATRLAAPAMSLR